MGWSGNEIGENRSNSERAYLHQSDAIDELLKPAARPIHEYRTLWRS